MTPQIKQRIEQVRRGEVPEGYKKTKVGIVPMEWEICSLSDISTKITESVGTRKLETLSISAGIGFVNQAKKFGKELSGKQYKKYTVLHKNDFSYNKGNSKKYPQGCIYRLIDREEAAVPDVFECFRINNQNNIYFEQLFASGFLNKELSKRINHGVRDNGLLNLTGRDFYKSAVMVPPLSDQKKIAEILQTQDKLIELQQKKIEELKKLKKVYLSKMFPKKGCNVPEIRFPGFTDPWEQRKLGDIADIVGGGTPSTGNQSYWDGDIDWYAPAEIADQIYANSSQKKITGLGYENSSAKMLPPGTVLFTSRAGIGKTAILTRKGCTNQGFQSIVPHRGELDSYFIFSRTEELKRYGELVGAGSTFVEVSGKQMAVMELMMPPTMREQQTIGDFFQQLDHLITLHQRKLEAMKTYKKSLMQLLLTGIVRTKGGSKCLSLQNR